MIKQCCGWLLLACAVVTWPVKITLPIAAEVVPSPTGLSPTQSFTECIKRIRAGKDPIINGVLDRLEVPNAEGVRQVVLDRNIPIRPRGSQTEPCVPPDPLNPGNHEFFPSGLSPRLLCTPFGAKNSSLVHWSPTKYNIAICGTKGGVAEPCEVLLHELSHAFNMQEGVFPRIEAPPSAMKKEERDAVAFENRFRKLLGLPPLCCYDGIDLDLPECKAPPPPQPCPPDRMAMNGKCAPAVLFKLEGHLHSDKSDKFATRSGESFEWGDNIADVKIGFAQLFVQGAEGLAKGVFNIQYKGADGTVNLGASVRLSPWIAGGTGRVFTFRRRDSWSLTPFTNYKGAKSGTSDFKEFDPQTITIGGGCTALPEYPGVCFRRWFVIDPWASFDHLGHPEFISAKMHAKFEFSIEFFPP